jgi:hypothetical protein
MVLRNVLAGEPDELFVVGAFQVVTAGTFDRTHRYLLGLYAFTVVPRAPYFSALRRVSSNLERA